MSGLLEEVLPREQVHLEVKLFLFECDVSRVLQHLEMMRSDLNVQSVQPIHPITKEWDCTHWFK